MLRKNYILILCLLENSTGSLSSQEINPGIQDDIVKEYTRLCPHAGSCASETHLQAPNRVTRGVDRMSVPCCDPCSCDPGCGKNCCPDKPGIAFDLPDEKAFKEVACIYAQYKPFAQINLNGIAYEMIDTCETGEANLYYTSCKRDYFKFDFDENLKNLPPVSGNISHRLYKNRNCALCNGEKETDLIYWKMELTCDETPPFVPASMHEVSNMVKENHCNILFNPSLQKHELNKCKKVIDMCNVTGQWETYDDKTVIACNSYTSIYAGLYKNVHCYLCNVNADTNSSLMCEKDYPTISKNSFVALLDFNKREQSLLTTRHDMQCLDTQVLDPIKNKCLVLLCGHGMILAEDRCIPLYSSLYGFTGIIYSKAISLVPQQGYALDEEDGSFLDGFSAEDIYKRINILGFDICTLYSFIKLKTNIETLITTLYTSNRTIVASDIEYIAIDIRIEERSAKNISYTIERLENTLANLNISGFIVSNRYIHVEKFQSAMNHLNDNTSLALNKSKLEMINSLEISDLLRVGLEHGFNDIGHGVIPLLLASPRTDCERSLSIDTYPFCPKIKVNARDYNIFYTEKTIYISDISVDISIDNISISENGKELILCIDMFTKLMDNYMAKSKFHENESLPHKPLTIVTIICTAVSLLSLLFSFTVYVLFPHLRTLPGLNNMGLILSLITFLAFSLVNNVTEISTAWLCRAVGISLHFCLLSAFSWMFVCTLHMVRVFATITNRSASQSNIKQFVHYVLLTVIIPVTIVTVTVLVSFLSTGGRSIGYANYPCYVEPDMLLFNVAIPVGVIVFLNLAMFAYVIITICRLPNIRKDSKHERHNIAIFAKLSTITGLTWIFGFVYQFTGITVFAYIFTMLNASQGVFIMFAFIVNKRFYYMMKQKQGDTSLSSMASKRTHIDKFSNINTSHNN